MPQATLMIEELASQMSKASGNGATERAMEPLIDPETGQSDGMVVDLLLERVAVFVRIHDTISPSHISYLGRLMARVHVNRGILYLPWTAVIPKPVELLASLSKIKIVRMEEATGAV